MVEDSSSDIKQLYWTTGDLAAEFGVSRQKVSDWADFFNLVLKRSSTGKRFFNENQREFLQVVHLLQASGNFTMIGIKNMIE